MDKTTPKENKAANVLQTRFAETQEQGETLALHMIIPGEKPKTTCFEKLSVITGEFLEGFVKTFHKKDPASLKDLKKYIGALMASDERIIDQFVEGYIRLEKQNYPS